MTSLSRDPDTGGGDTDMLAVNAFKEEGAFLFFAEQAAAGLARRIATGPRQSFVTIARDELEELSAQFTRAVAIGKEYHLGAADCVL